MTIKNYVFVVREYTKLTSIGGQSYIQECVGIAIRDRNKGIDYPSPLTNFIKSTYRRKSTSVSNQRNPAYEVCKFLNYCVDKIKEEDFNFIELRDKGIFGLQRNHASIYISDLSIRSRTGELDVNYVKQIIRYLNQFYLWMQEENLLRENVTFFFQQVHGKTVLKGDIFDDIRLGTIYPPNKKKRKTKLVDFGKHRYELVEVFLDIAENFYPDIYVGICLQFFGGLRKGEVINLTRDSLIKKDDGFLVNVDDRRHILFPDKKNIDAEQAKVPRMQALLWNNRLKYAIEEHFNKLDAWKVDGKITNYEALLVNSNTGKPVTGKVYWEQFNKVKEMFFTRLSDEGKTKQFNFVTSLPWSTHLARGVFTNFCFDIGMSLSEVAIARGDSSLSSVLDYVEELAAYESMTEAMNNIRKAFNHGSGKIDSTVISSKYLNVWGSSSAFSR